MLIKVLGSSVEETQTHWSKSGEGMWRWWKDWNMWHTKIDIWGHFPQGRESSRGTGQCVWHMLKLIKKMEPDFSHCHPMKAHKEKDKLKYRNFHLNIRHVVRSRHMLSVLSMGVPLGKSFKGLLRKILFNFTILLHWWECPISGNTPEDNDRNDGQIWTSPSFEGSSKMIMNFYVDFKEENSV